MMLFKQARIRIFLGIISSFLVTIILSHTFFPHESPEPSLVFLSTLPSIRLPIIASKDTNTIEPTKSNWFESRTADPTDSVLSPTPTSSFGIPTNTVVPTNSTVPTLFITRTPTPSPRPSRTPTPKQNATTLCGQSPTSLPDWGADAPYSEVCVYDANMQPVAMKQLCRAVCKSDNCTESICVANGSYGKFNRGSKHGGYDGYGFKMSREDSQGKTRSILEVRPNSPGKLKDCITISGKCYLWDYWLSGVKSASIIVSSP